MTLSFCIAPAVDADAGWRPTLETKDQSVHDAFALAERLKAAGADDSVVLENAIICLEAYGWSYDGD
jgi:hypothetical protein